MAVNLGFLAWCEDERAASLRSIDDIKCGLTAENLPEEEAAHLRVSLERHIRYIKSLNEAMAGHRELHSDFDAWPSAPSTRPHSSVNRNILFLLWRLFGFRNVLTCLAARPTRAIVEVTRT